MNIFIFFLFKFLYIKLNLKKKLCQLDGSAFGFKVKHKTLLWGPSLKSDGVSWINQESGGNSLQKKSITDDAAPSL